MANFYIIEPITITDTMVGSAAGTVTERDHPEWVTTDTYPPFMRCIVKGGPGVFSQVWSSSDTWAALTAASNGNVYAAELGGSIWMQTKGTGAFVDLVTGSKNWSGLAAHPNGNIYATVNTFSAVGGIWMQTAGAGSFADLGALAGDKDWWAICCAPSGDVYAAVAAGSIWMQTKGTGAFNDLTAGSKNWSSMCVSPNGNVYAAVGAGDIWMQTGGVGAFNALGGTSRAWAGMAAAPNGDIYASVTGGTIYKQTSGTGAFVSIGTTVANWAGLAIAAGGAGYGIYSAVNPGGIWTSTLETLHKIYESIPLNNVYNYPPIDVRHTTPKWLEIGSTNKWRVFDGKTGSQTEQVSPIVYTITPGVAVNSVALFNVAATSVRIQATTGTYSNTISTGATDIVDMALPGGAADVITITITNSAGLAKVGEIVLGNYYSLGKFMPGPQVGITDYSIKTADEFGDYVITERSYSKNFTGSVLLAMSAMDAVNLKMTTYRAAPLVWVGSTSYSSLLAYGFYRDFKLTPLSPLWAELTLDVIGLT